MITIQEICSASLDLLFPPSCTCCRKVIPVGSNPLCMDCLTRLKFIHPPYCPCCGTMFPGDGENHLCGTCLQSSPCFDKARSLFHYEDTIARLIYDLKYAGKTTGLDTLHWLSTKNTILNDLHTAEVILPVPLHLKRLRQRGFNQALILARSLFPAELDKIHHDVLVRKANTPFQTGLSGKQRRRNLKNAFRIEKPGIIAGKNILLVDDVFTTGSTVSECCKILKAAEAGKIQVLTLARVAEFGSFN